MRHILSASWCTVHRLFFYCVSDHNSQRFSFSSFFFCASCFPITFEKGYVCSKFLVLFCEDAHEVPLLVVLGFFSCYWRIVQCRLGTNNIWRGGCWPCGWPSCPWYLIGGLISFVEFFVLRNILFAVFQWLWCFLSTLGRYLSTRLLPFPAPPLHTSILAFVCLPDYCQPSIFLTTSSLVEKSSLQRKFTQMRVYGLWILWSSEPVMQ